MSRIVWLSSMSIGFDKWDSDHRTLLVLLDRLDDALQAGNSAEVVGPALDRLAEYAEIHFRSEEDAMERFGYPRVASHKEEHQRLRDWVGEQRARLAGSPAEAATRDMAEYLVHWIYTHVLTADMDYAEFFDGHRRQVLQLLTDYPGLPDASG